MARVENYFFRLFGIMLMFQLMNAHSECIGGIVLHDGTAGLEDDGAVIIMFVYKMNGNAGFGIAGRQNGFVHKAAIHAFAAVIGQQCGMYINNIASGKAPVRACGTFQRKPARIIKEMPASRRTGT